MSWLLRESADDFLLAYKVLQNNYESASLRIMGPSIVNLAFATELYLKDFYNALGIETPKGKKGHDIHYLFENLPEHNQQDIFAHDLIQSNPLMMQGDTLSVRIFSKKYTPFERFCDQIKLISNAFVQWRYSHEHCSLSYDSSFALTFIDAIKSVTDKERANQRASIIQSKSNI